MFKRYCDICKVELDKDEEVSYFDPCLGYNFEEALENIEQYDLREE